jgi:hypothetical protein
MSLTVHVDTTLTVLSGVYRVYKTERLLKQTTLLRHTDKMLDAVAGGILTEVERLPRLSSDAEYLSVATADRAHVFWLKVTADSLIFCGYDSTMESLWREDNRFVSFLSANPRFELTVTVGRPNYPASDFEKLYKLSLTDGVYFPCLNPQQRALVTSEESNILVQGVAGSGKTNVCIDKILYAACRGYGGKVLYTTYSRGLLMDTKMRVERWKENLVHLATAMAANTVLFVDEDKQAAVTNRLGLYLAEDCTDALTAKLREIATWLDAHVDYLLIQDIYTSVTGESVRLADEDYFVHTYMGEMRNYFLAGRLDKIKALSQEVIYKEIFGLIEGWCDPLEPERMLDREGYVALRRDSFAKSECETIYGIAEDYARHLAKAGREDNNTLSRKLLSRDLPRYSLVIADEVQDFAQVTLTLLARLAQKMFAVGDALQMINPAYFNFAYLKRLLFDQETARVSTLVHNYRSGKRIQEVIEALGVINEAQFGTHNFVLKGNAVSDDGNTNACFVSDQGDFVDAVRRADLGDLTFVTSDRVNKEAIRRALPEHEVLTVSEIKGLERDNVVLYHLLGANMAQWQTMARKWIDRKTADENSVYRYYFNLFYVGVSRARRNLYVLEGETPPLFDDLLLSLDQQSTAQAMDVLRQVAGKKLEEAEQLERVEQFITLGQYENAAHAAGKLSNGAWHQKRINVYADLVNEGKLREAGIAFWQLGATEDADKCFVLAGETGLVDLMHATLAAGEGALNVDMLRFYPDLDGNQAAQHALVGIVEDDLSRLRGMRRHLTEVMKKRR